MMSWGRRGYVASYLARSYPYFMYSSGRRKRPMKNQFERGPTLYSNVQVLSGDT